MRPAKVQTVQRHTILIVLSRSSLLRYVENRFRSTLLRTRIAPRVVPAIESE